MIKVTNTWQKIYDITLFSYLRYFVYNMNKGEYSYINKKTDINSDKCKKF